MHNARPCLEIVGDVDEHDVDYCGAEDTRRGAYVMDTAAMRRDDAASAVAAGDGALAAAADEAPPLPPGALIAGIAAGKVV